MSLIASWALSAGLPMDVEDVLAPDTIDRFIRVTAKGADGTQRTMRDTLNRVGRRVTRTAPWPPTKEPIGRSHIAPPYAARDVDRLFAAAEHQLTEERRDLMCALLGLGLGCGLDGRWILAIGPSDIRRTETGVHVSVDTPHRTITALHRYEHHVERAAQTIADRPGERLYRADSAMSSALKRMQPAEGTGLQLARLRSTWLVEHLNVGTPLAVLLDAAGLKTPHFDEFIPLLARPDSATRNRLLRGRQ